MKLCMGCMSQIHEHDHICPICGYVEGTSPSEMYYLFPGTELGGRYILGKVLGYGSFGITYIGYDILLQMPVAIKEFFPSDCATRSKGTKSVKVFSGNAVNLFKSGLESFIAEARRLAQLQGLEGVVQIYDCIMDNNTGYIIMEYLRGQTVREILKEQKKVPYNEAKNIIVKVLDSLEVIHEEGIIHRDVAPDNVFITNQGEVKLIDFGAARYAVSAQSHSLTRILKPGYAPEEQYRSGGQQGPWTDVYAAGATFYRMITGRRPPEAIERLGQDDLLHPSDIGVEIPAKDEKVLLKALAVKKDDRYLSASEFRKQLLMSDDDAPGAPQKRIFPFVMIGAAVILILITGISTLLRNENGKVSTVIMGKNTPTPKKIVTNTSTPKPTITNTPTPKPTATNTPTPKPTATNTPTPKPTATSKPTPTNTPTPKPTATSTPTPKPTATSTPTPKPTATSTPIPSKAPKVYTEEIIVRAVQTELNNSGYSCGAVDGIAGEKTKKAIEDYQISIKIKNDGLITDKLLIALGIDPDNLLEKAISNNNYVYTSDDSTQNNYDYISYTDAITTISEAEKRFNTSPMRNSFFEQLKAIDLTGIQADKYEWMDEGVIGDRYTTKGLSLTFFYKPDITHTLLEIEIDPFGQRELRLCIGNHIHIELISDDHRHSTYWGHTSYNNVLVDVNESDHRVNYYDSGDNDITEYIVSEKPEDNRELQLREGKEDLIQQYMGASLDEMIIKVGRPIKSEYARLDFYNLSSRFYYYEDFTVLTRVHGEYRNYSETIKNIWINI